MSSSRDRFLGLIAAICLFFIVIFLLPTRVGGRVHVPGRDVQCNNRGYRNASDSLCTCITPYYGEACEYKHCPFGTSWFSIPVQDNVRNMPLVPCSNMGYCDPLHGNCYCRHGFEGSACQRTVCPTTYVPVYSKEASVTTSSFSGNPNIFIGSPGGGSSSSASSAVAGTSPAMIIANDLSNSPACSGHGQCKTLRDAGAEFNGISLVKAPVDYSNWDADKIQGCVCDPGWQGYDCSLRSCPMGRDPTTMTDDDTEEVYELQCQADSGFFAIFILGYYTEPIPFDATPADLKYTLESISNVGTVHVEMTASAATDYLPTLCASTFVATTKLIFSDSKVPLGQPIFLTTSTANTRRWPGGSHSLSLSSGVYTLRMATQHTLKCPICANCFGKVYFIYQSSVSSPVDIMANNAASLVKLAIEGLEDLQAAQWPNMVVGVTISNSLSQESICTSSAVSTVAISISSDYGNIPFLSILDASYYSASSIASANLVFTTNAGTTKLYECSNQGVCDYSTGRCKCLDRSIAGTVIYRTTSSDGNGGIGTRGDCGRLAQKVTACSYELNGQVMDTCSGHGFCTNTTSTCACYDGYHGITCELQDCPMGRAWFDEPTASDTAHGNMGMCDRSTGLCTCRDGFIGAACDIRDCDRDKTTFESCSGHGVCINTAQLFELFGHTYGNVTTDYIKAGGDNWDAFSWYHCLCSANIAAGFMADPLRPSVGPSGLITGYSPGALPIPGWSNWDCSKRNCPMGHTSDARSGYKAVKEIQRIVCGLSVYNDEQSFTLSFMDHQTSPIYTNYSATEIKAAIEYCPLIGNVSVFFPNIGIDGVTSACHTNPNETYGGFLVQFDTEFGDLPLFSSSTSLNITISEFRAGNSTNLECGGPTVGFCERITGNCVCNNKRTSSDGTGVVNGNAGDCGYEIPYPDATKDKYTLFGFGVPDL